MQEIKVTGIDHNMHPIYQLLCCIQENRDIYQSLLNNSVNGDMAEPPLDIAKLISSTSVAVLESPKTNI